MQDTVKKSSVKKSTPPFKTPEKTSEELQQNFPFQALMELNLGIHVLIELSQVENASQGNLVKTCGLN